MCIHNVKIDMDDMVRTNVYRTMFEIIDLKSIILNVKSLKYMNYKIANFIPVFYSIETLNLGG